MIERQTSATANAIQALPLQLPITKVLFTSQSLMSIVMDMKSYSTAQVAGVIGVSKKTLLRWLWAEKLAEPKQTMGALNSRVWTEADLKRAKVYKEQNYRKRP